MHCRLPTAGSSLRARPRLRPARRWAVRWSAGWRRLGVRGRGLAVGERSDSPRRHQRTQCLGRFAASSARRSTRRRRVRPASSVAAADLLTQFIFNTALFVIHAIYLPSAIHTLQLSATDVGVTLAAFGVGMIGGAVFAA